jgi:hypothetical protein
MTAYATVRARWAAALERWWLPLAIALGATAALMFLWTLIPNVNSSPGWGYDFAAYYNAAVRLLDTGSPYQVRTLTLPFRPGPGGLYLYSPVPALLLVPLTSIDYDSATVL